MIHKNMFGQSVLLLFFCICCRQQMVQLPIANIIGHIDWQVFYLIYVSNKGLSGSGLLFIVFLYHCPLYRHRLHIEA